MICQAIATKLLETPTIWETVQPIIKLLGVIVGGFATMLLNSIANSFKSMKNDVSDLKNYAIQTKEWHAEQRRDIEELKDWKEEREKASNEFWKLYGNGLEVMREARKPHK